MLKKSILLLAVLLLGATLSYAADTDAFEVSCTLLLTYGITISTPDAGVGGLIFSNVNVGETLVNDTSSATITNSGGVTADWTIKGTELTEWTLGAVPGDNVASLYGTLKAAAPIVLGDFDVAFDTITTTEPNMDGTNYTNDQTGNDVDESVSDERLLWIRLDTPTDTDYQTEQKFRVEIKAYPASTF